MSIFVCPLFWLSLKITDENPLPDGTYPILLSQATQEHFECVAEWDLYIQEPQKIVQLEKIKEDLKKPESDFTPLKDHIKVGAHFFFRFNIIK